MRLSDPDSPWAELLELRFQPKTDSPLRNMALGNLLLAALSQSEQHFASAIEKALKMFGCRGRILPVTADPAHLAAQLDDGSIVRGEVAVRQPGKPPIKKLWVEDTDSAHEPALQAIREADFLLIGPGNLYTSVAACLVVPGVAEAIAQSRGRRIYIPNTTTYPGQTDGYSVLDHIRVIQDLLPDAPLHDVILNTERPSQRIYSLYRAHDVHVIPVEPRELPEIVERGCRAITGALLEPALDQTRKLHKLDTVRHDPAKLGEVVREMYNLSRLRMLKGTQAA